MKQIIRKYLREAIHSYLPNTKIDIHTLPVEYTRVNCHGDFSSSIALILSKQLKKSPISLAENIVQYLKNMPDYSIIFDKIEIAQPGFINFFIQRKHWLSVIGEVLHQTHHYGYTNIGQNKPICVEFVSSNPTGPLHVGHGRSAAQGAMIVRLLKAVGYQAHAEYYVNDAGRQVDILACSIWIRYLEACGESLSFPVNAYQGEYIRQIALAYRKKYGAQIYKSNPEIINTLTAYTIEEPPSLESLMDALIAQIKSVLGEKSYAQLVAFGVEWILQDMREDLQEFGVYFDKWFSEKSLIEDGSVSKTIEQLKDNGYTYSAEGNLWFRSTHFGDDKDRVLLRANGQPTYFAVDAAYRLNILQTRKFTRIINLLGSDHHGYLARIHAVIQALGYPKDCIVFNNLQMVSLYRDNKKLALSTRSGEFITLRALRTEVGNDPTRLFFVLRKSSQPIDFDLNLAKAQSHQNPVYYLQYAYARIASVIRQLEAKNIPFIPSSSTALIERLVLEEEINLSKWLARYPDVILQAADQYEPYILVQYLRDLAKYFHTYYNHTPFITAEEPVRNARLTLIKAIQQILKNGFSLLGIQPLEVM